MRPCVLSGKPRLQDLRGLRPNAARLERSLAGSAAATRYGVTGVTGNREQGTERVSAHWVLFDTFRLSAIRYIFTYIAFHPFAPVQSTPHKNCPLHLPTPEPLHDYSCLTFCPHLPGILARRVRVWL